MQIVQGKLVSLQPALIQAMSRYRHRVFVERLGWRLRTENGLEVDQFDGDSTLYVIALDEEERIVGTARLLPTTGSYLLGEVFPQLLNGQPPISSPKVWELSRFAAVDLQARTSAPASQLSSATAIGLLQASLACAARQGAERVLTISPPGVERLLRAAGFRAHRLGVPMMVDGEPIFACSIACGTAEVQA